MTKLLILLSFFFIGCNKLNSNKSSLNFYKVEKKDFNKYINKKNIRDGVDLQNDIHLMNRDYPIEISIYDNGKWFYRLDNLGDGNGTWKYEEGKLKLFAERVLFDMYIDIEAIEKDGSDIVIKFSDRFGPQTLKVEKINLK